ncbi:MAG: hypothetical protein E4H14_09045 [Candidatus Thorarchaeota archaeon]|nr:MAG: hypothetical protein E4H14_09045 [Candidatus Thorarchaeota archaeon]
MDTKDVLSFWKILKRPRIDYFIFFIAFLLLASNQIFETTPLRASGIMEVTDGSAIPQDTNYTLTAISDQKVSSAIIFNKSIQRDFLSLDVVVDAMNETVCNITLQSPFNNTSVDIYMEFGHYQTNIQVVVGQIPEIYSIIPNMDDVKYYEYLTTRCYLSFDSDIQLIVQNVMLWATFEVPVSPLVLDYKTTDGSDLFGNNYTALIRFDGLELVIRRMSDGYLGDITVKYQNYTLYLPTQNYTLTSVWARQYHTRFNFNITLFENITTHCLFHMKAVRIYLAFDSSYPLIRLSINRYDDSFPNFEIYFRETEVPEYVYIPPYFLFDIKIATITPLSGSIYHASSDISIQTRISSNSTNDFHVRVLLPYFDIAGIIFTPQDFIQIVLALFLFILITLRIFTHLHSKRPRYSWKDPRLIPIFIFSIIACIPWYWGTHEMSYLSEYPFHIASFGTFPLVGCWTESSSLFLFMPSNGVFWAFTSLMFFWIPLLLSNYYTTPPSDVGNNFVSAILLFSPFLLSSIIPWSLSEIYSFELQNYLPSFIILVPVSWLLCVIILPFLGLYNYGPHKDQLSLDAKLSSQITDPEILPSAQESEYIQSYSDEQKEIRAQKTLGLVLTILLSILLIVPTSLTTIFELTGTAYVLDSQYYVSPINAIEKVCVLIFNLEGVSALWILGIPLYYFFIIGLLSSIGMRTRPVLSAILATIWVCLPFIFLQTLYGIVYHYYLQIDWVVISFPYYLLSIVTILKILEYIRNEIKLKTVVAWILIPVIAIIPGTLIMNWVSIVTTSTFHITTWSPLPLFSILVLVIIWPLRKWISGILPNNEVDSELDDILHPDNVTEDL